MIVARSIEEISETIESSCLTIGNFDGVHLGHQKLIRRTREKAGKHGHSCVVVTFDPHPLRVLVGPDTPPFITLTEQKLELIEKLGPEITVVMPFDRELAALPPDEFVRRYLVRGLNMRDMVIGYDYAFGKKRAGNYEMLKYMGENEGFGVERLGPVLVGGAVVSSTRIRDLVRAGRVWDARSLLGRFYIVRGRVARGRDRGAKLLGFPTANLALTDELVPKTGVYAVWVVIDGKPRRAVANIGFNPTFGNETVSVEVHVMDFDADLYETVIDVHFVQRLRSEKKFDGVDKLKHQIGRDVQLAKTILDSSEAQP
jgi:riboflavin kinase/FMN adenylyltransferase